MNTSFLIICSFVAFLTPLIFSWLQTVHRSLYFNAFTSCSQAVVNSLLMITKVAKVRLSNCLSILSCSVHYLIVDKSFPGPSDVFNDIILGKYLKNIHTCFFACECSFSDTAGKIRLALITQSKSLEPRPNCKFG